jgi:hypothetical protein
VTELESEQHDQLQQLQHHDHHHDNSGDDDGDDRGSSSSSKLQLHIIGCLPSIRSINHLKVTPVIGYTPYHTASQLDKCIQINPTEVADSFWTPLDYFVSSSPYQNPGLRIEYDIWWHNDVFTYRHYDYIYNKNDIIFMNDQGRIKKSTTAAESATKFDHGNDSGIGNDSNRRPTSPSVKAKSFAITGLTAHIMYELSRIVSCSGGNDNHNHNDNQTRLGRELHGQLTRYYDYDISIHHQQHQQSFCEGGGEGEENDEDDMDNKQEGDGSSSSSSSSNNNSGPSHTKRINSSSQSSVSSWYSKKQQCYYVLVPSPPVPPVSSSSSMSTSATPAATTPAAAAAVLHQYDSRQQFMSKGKSARKKQRLILHHDDCTCIVVPVPVTVMPVKTKSGSLCAGSSRNSEDEDYLFQIRTADNRICWTVGTSSFEERKVWMERIEQLVGEVAQ